MISIGKDESPDGDKIFGDLMRCFIEVINTSLDYCKSHGVPWKVWHVASTSAISSLFMMTFEKHMLTAGIDEDKIGESLEKISAKLREALQDAFAEHGVEVTVDLMGWDDINKSIQDRIDKDE